MPNPLGKSPAQAPQWLSTKVWEQILSSDTTAFLAAYGPGIRAERWGNALRWISSAPLVTPPPHPPSLSWQPTTILFQEELNPPATFLLGETFQQEVTELGLHYAIDLSPNISPGLFPDQRENRIHLKSLRPARLLNLFAHTCAFGVLAASVGAETLNIDSSSRSLARGKTNYQLNHLGGSPHRFWTEDVRRVLPRLARRGETFDAIILDPPRLLTVDEDARFESTVNSNLFFLPAYPFSHHVAPPPLHQSSRNHPNESFLYGSRDSPTRSLFRTDPTRPSP